MTVKKNRKYKGYTKGMNYSNVNKVRKIEELKEGVRNKMSDENKVATSLNVTTFGELKEYSKGTLVRLPDFAEGQPFVARIKRPSMLQMVKSGSIPNSLLSKANSMFFDGGNSLKLDDEEIMSQMFDIIEGICEQSFIEPTYEQIKESGIILTDEQMMFIFNYSQRGVFALESFRNKQRN